MLTTYSTIGIPIPPACDALMQNQTKTAMRRSQGDFGSNVRIRAAGLSGDAWLFQRSRQYFQKRANLILGIALFRIREGAQPICGERAEMGSLLLACQVTSTKDLAPLPRPRSPLFPVTKKAFGMG